MHLPEADGGVLGHREVILPGLHQERAVPGRPRRNRRGRRRGRRRGHLGRVAETRHGTDQGRHLRARGDEHGEADRAEQSPARGARDEGAHQNDEATATMKAAMITPRLIDSAA